MWPTCRKKRERRPETWQRNIRKRLCNTGEEYISRTGKIVPKKVFNNIDCGCTKKCFDKLDSSEREIFFNTFWEFGDRMIQNSYICDMIEKLPIKRSINKDGSRPPKTCTYRYNLRSSDTNVIVCRKYFEDTFQISHGRLLRALSVYKWGSHSVFVKTESTQ